MRSLATRSGWSLPRLPPLVHFLALSALGAVPALVNDAMRPDIMVYTHHVGVAWRCGRRHHPALDGLPSGPRTARPRFVALTWRWRPATPTLVSCRRTIPTGTLPTTSWHSSTLRHDRHP
ncbi:MAG: hypothetical protein R2734_08150 [Nocardioides sp.]